MKTSDKILLQLKRGGPSTAVQLSKILGISSMGVRQHLQSLEEAGDLFWKDHKAERGRPTRYWYLAQTSQRHFENRHEELSVVMIDSVRQVFGEAGLDKLISHREQATLASYSERMTQCEGLEQKLNALALVRSEEGYMASVEQIDGDWYLLENHCPICAAAKACQNFCRSELELFQTLLGNDYIVRREEHIVSGSRRCSYKISNA
ncbi:transcriptional regulator [Alginatibacterium sediminis]|uniref:Transcriptional regulator n=1 Tax=Alginatibacterium sediminis TaxID=2164068 RepID=A0A420E7K2_9ALTE|nr:metalloregulator ArsR/SmtB family transcription factor [Alginatibacterium sediminis]RKF14502.1 transcriptional regulator [Alginatibacterium sediminis]